MYPGLMPIGVISQPPNMSIGPFFSSARKYIVVGASNNPQKFGYKVLDWYVSHNLPVTPINPKEPEILAIKTYPSIFEALDEIESSDGFSISFITPPKITEAIVEKLGKYSSVKGLWFQPGSFNDAVLENAKKIDADIVIDDDCILVSGDQGLAQAKL